MIELYINSEKVIVEPGTTVAAAILNLGIGRFRRSVAGSPRAPLCGMGICFECRVMINGSRHERSCLITAAPGMEVSTDD